MVWKIQVTVSPLSTPSWTQKGDTTCLRMNCFRCPHIPEPEHEVCELSHRPRSVTFVLALTLARSSPVENRGRIYLVLYKITQLAQLVLGHPLPCPTKTRIPSCCFNPVCQMRPNEASGETWARGPGAGMQMQGTFRGNT